MARLYVTAILLSFSLLCAEESFQKVDDECTLQIVTPDLAQRKSAKIRLTNGLEAYLISDPGVNQSCAALAVKAGSWEDPEQYPGMAHFLEHMLFMGTAAYPKESEYTTFISDHGGSRNAYTASDKTVYAFSINNDFFAAGVDRFSHFFIDPLFLQNSVERELKNVDQEHGKNLEHDGWRAHMILKETGNPAHPNAKFSTGNGTTLSGIPRSELKKWYEQHYSADRMHLVMISPLPIDTLIHLAVEKFSPVTKKTAPSAAYPFDLLSEEQKGHFLYIKPVKDLKSLSLVWQLPKEIAIDEETHSIALVAYAIGNGTQNSLCEELKREKLVEGISVSTDFFSSECALFNIDFSLTDKGVKELESIIQKSFQTIACLKKTGLPAYIYEEHQKLSLINYEHQSRKDAFRMAMHIAGTLPQEKLETYPEKMVRARRFDPQQVQLILNSLTPESCAYLVMADPKLTGIHPTQHEKWMNAPYTFKSIEKRDLMAWATASPHPHIGLPAPNPYFPDSLALAWREETTQNGPSIIANDERGQIYFLQDQKYLVPETSIIFNIKTPQMDRTALSMALFDLYIRALSDKIATPIFLAKEAGLSALISHKDDSFIIESGGYNEKTPLFLKTIFESLRHISPTAAEFEIFKQSVLSMYDNASKELPINQGCQLLKSILVNRCPTAQQKYQALSQLTYEQFLAFATEIFDQVYVEGTLYGNLTSTEALQIWNDFNHSVHPNPFPKAEHYKNAVLLPSDQQGPFMVVQPTERQGNGTVLLIHEGPFSLENRAIQQIVSSALQDDFFDTLRSKQHTGYIASSWDLEIEEQLFQVFGVQSITHEATELLARYDLFLEEFTRHLQDKIAEDRFNTLKQTLIQELKRPPDNLVSNAHLLHHLAFEKKGDFEWISKRIASVEALEYETFLKQVRNIFSRQNHRRIAVLMEGILPTQNQLRYELISEEKIRDTGSYISAK